MKYLFLTLLFINQNILYANSTLKKQNSNIDTLINSISYLQANLDSLEKFKNDKKKFSDIIKLQNKKLQASNEYIEKLKTEFDSLEKRIESLEKNRKLPEENSEKENTWFIITIISIVVNILLFILFFKLLQKMQRLNSKFRETKVSIEKSIANSKSTLQSFNSLIVSLGKDEEINTKTISLSAIEKYNNNHPTEIFLEDLNYDLNEIARKCKILENCFLSKKVLENEEKCNPIISPDQITQDYEKTKQELNKEKEDLKQINSNQISKESLFVPLYEIPKEIYINSNVLVSAGPRKNKEDDTELGEDSTGIINTTYGSYFWILDGTSDSKSIVADKEHIFSSRILAQLMNKNIREQLLKKENIDLNLFDVLTDSISSTKANLIEKLNKAPISILEKIQSSIISNNPPFCSTTVLFGFLSKSGELKYLLLGDSVLLSFSTINSQLKLNDQIVNENPSRLFISIDFDGFDYKLKNNSFEEKYLSKTENNVDLIVAFSDGIGISEKTLKINPLIALSKISLVNQLTYDDKTLLLLERINCKHNEN